ncbi:MAG: hypothetical protein L0Y45_04960 [Woeseiaceae bacterium]|nr:hypothetical protein [Woeseiaceae bacterium]
MALFASSVAIAAADAGAEAPLRFSVAEGRVQNEFFRQGPVAAHLVLTSGPDARLVVAFPAGNSGAALWFDSGSKAINWQLEEPVTAARLDVDGGTLHGIRAVLVAAGAAMTVKHAILSSVRVIRDYGYTGETPREVLVDPVLSGRTVTWQRRRLDGAPGYFLLVEVLAGAIKGGGNDPVQLLPDKDGRLRLAVTALSGDEPLMALGADGLLTDAAIQDAQLHNTLAFLSYREKLLAGSWRFNTYFGRDTLMTLQLLMPVLEPPLAEAGLAAVLSRLNIQGEVAHEEDIGEYAVLRHMRAGDAPIDAPIYDYKMIDDDFMLPIVAANYFLATEVGRERAVEFLAQATDSDETRAALLLRNFRFVVSASEAFARDPRWQNLVALRPGEHAGNWRDSEHGLGGGRIPYDVNGVFVPAALTAINEFLGSGLLDGFADAETLAALAKAGDLATVWSREAPVLFEVDVARQAARSEVERYAARIGVQASAALATVPQDGVRFRAVALDGQGKAVQVLNSDEAFALLFLDLPGTDVERIVTTLMRPFPAGLLTDVGPVVATPAYADDAMEPLFDRSRYHGTVIWSWQQAVLSAGIDRQLARNDHTPAIREVLTQARTKLAAALSEAHDIRGSELWSWSEIDGRYHVEPFGQRQQDETESNAAQLWSTVHLRAGDTVRGQ